MRRRMPRGGRQLLPVTYRGPGERREYLASLGLVAILQAAIAATLGVCAAQTYHLWKQGVAYVPRDVGRVVPAVLLVVACLAMLAALRTTGRIRRALGVPIETSGTEEKSR